MAVRNVIIVVLFSVILCIFWRYYFLSALFFNYYIVRRLRNSRILYFNLFYNEVILTSQKNLSHHLLIELISCVGFILTCFLCFIYMIVSDHIIEPVFTNLQTCIITICIWTGIFYFKKMTKSEILYLSSINNLTCGYGGAISYYKNYLSRLLPEKFLAGVAQYETKEGVRIPDKLYILFPKSCKVKKYIDNTENIEYAKDLPSFKIDLGGIKDREYRISVYRLKYNGKYFRCALDYAQPLKTLLALKENGKISLSEMHTERERFRKKLLELLRDRENSLKFCELVEYDDETEDIHVVLSSKASLQEYKYKEVE